MMYTRSQSIDFDSWDTPGWTGKDMLEMCKKLETFHASGPEIDVQKHGYEGPVHVSDGGYKGKSENAFMDTVKSMGYKEIVDLQDGEACGGWSVSFLLCFGLVITFISFSSSPIFNKLISFFLERNGTNTSLPPAAVKMQLTPTSTHFFNPPPTPIFKYFLNPKSYV